MVVNGVSSMTWTAWKIFWLNKLSFCTKSLSAWERKTLYLRCAFCTLRRSPSPTPQHSTIVSVFSPKFQLNSWLELPQPPLLLFLKAHHLQYVVVRGTFFRHAKNPTPRKRGLSYGRGPKTPVKKILQASTTGLS